MSASFLLYILASILSGGSLPLCRPGLIISGTLLTQKWDNRERGCCHLRRVPILPTRGNTQTHRHSSWSRRSHTSPFSARGGYPAHRNTLHSGTALPPAPLIFTRLSCPLKGDRGLIRKTEEEQNNKISQARSAGDFVLLNHSIMQVYLSKIYNPERLYIPWNSICLKFYWYSKLWS